MDEASQHYAGDSSVYSATGELIATSQEAEVLVVELFAEQLQEYRARFPAHLDADNFELRG
jgi:predicted amidohydrolase